MSITSALTLRRGRGRLHWTDVASYAYLLLGVVLMFGPVLWLGLSSFKTQAGLLEFPPSLLPTSQKEVSVPGYDKPLPLFNVTMEDGSTRVLAQARRIGLQAQMIDPAEPGKIIRVALDKRTPLRETAFANQAQNFGLAAAASVVLGVVLFALTLLQLGFSRRKAGA